MPPAPPCATSSPRSANAQTRFLAPSWCTCPPTIRPATARRTRSAPRALLEALGFAVERHPVPDAAVQRNGMMSCTNLVVRERFGAAGPIIALNAHGDVVPPGVGLDRRSVRRRGARRLHVRPRRRGVEVRLRDLHVRAARAARPRRGRALERHDRAALHLRRGGRRRDRPGAGCSRRGISRARLRDLRRASPTASRRRTTAACISRSRWSASRGTPPSPRRAIDALEAADGASSPDLYALRKALRRARVDGARASAADARRRPDQGRHQHQRGARPRDVPPRPPHHPRGESGRRRARADAR